ncbi:MAG TPA: glycosyltransferase, partial [Allocoleopsis sp.]
SGDLEGMCQQILNDDLHVLTFLDIGMHPKAGQIASLRLAPVQCMTWGHPVTSGLPTVDYFLSSDLMEPENGEAHYSEQLVRLPGIGIAYAKPTIPELTKTRADFGLRSDAVVYLSCQSLFKYLPQYDFVFAAIAQQVPQAQFAFLAHFSPAVTDKFRQRLQRAFAAVGLNSEDYCVMVPRQGPTSYLQLNLLSDIFLDTFAWSGGNTTLEAIACNLPVVTCPGEFMRGRHAAGILKALGIPEAIAANPEEYVAIAVKLGLNAVWRQEIVQRITQGHDQLYDDPSCVKALEAFYQQVVQAGV